MKSDVCDAAEPGVIEPAGAGEWRPDIRFEVTMDDRASIVVIADDPCMVTDVYDLCRQLAERMEPDGSGGVSFVRRTALVRVLAEMAELGEPQRWTGLSDGRDVDVG